MKVTRKFTKQGQDVFANVQWTKRSSRIGNLDGSTVFEMNDAEVPKSWSQLATDIMVSKYFRKAGVPAKLEVVKEKGVPAWLCPQQAKGDVETGPEKSARQVIHRLVGCWTYWGFKHDYFDSEEDARAFYDELCYMMVHQQCAPNSPQWFNTGLHWAYGVNGPAQGHYYTDPKTGETKRSEDAYTHPQPHACFIQSIDDDLVSPGGIMDLWVREARLFKYGSGTGTNFSKLRAENESLSGGGRSSGLMSFLKIGDRAAGAIKSGGTTRRAAKMVCLDLDHPDVEAFINWKVREELKVAALVEGLKQLPKSERAVAEQLDLKLDYDFNGEAYITVSGQNSNNSIRIPNRFFEALDKGEDWTFVRRTDGEVARTVPARALWDQVGFAAWRCADPGVQFDTTINQWHTCPESGRINASNPCSEYMFLDDTACNLASLNVLKFYDAKQRTFDVEAYEHGVHLWTVVLEISVLMAQYPSEAIARLSYEYRTLGLGYANLGAMLMQAGIPYDSERARAICGALTAILTGRSYATSAEMASEHGAFAGYEKNRDAMLRVIRNHRRAAYGVSRKSSEAAGTEQGDYEALDIKPVPIDETKIDGRDGSEPELGQIANAQQLIDRSRATWDDALSLGEKHGYRNAQTTVIAPTGTIGLLMDCDTTGVEPDFALVKFKKLAGGGYFKIANQSLKPALDALGYSEAQVHGIMTYVMGTLNLDVPMPGGDGEPTSEDGTFAEYLTARGFEPADIAKVSDSLPTVFELQHAFNAWTLGEEAIDRLGLTEQAKEPSFNLLRAIGLTRQQIAALNRAICGTQTVEGAPQLKEEHLPVFDCANTCGPTGERYIAAEGHIRMMAASQPFITGAISKTINLPNSASVDDIKSCYRLSWELGLKANALYRDGCKLSQVLNNKVDVDDEVEDEEAIEAGKEEVASEVAQAGRVAAAATSGAGSDATAAIDRQPIERVVEKIVERPLRRRLPDTRRSITHKFNVAGHEGYLNVGLYDDGTPGELFITMAKEGSTIGGLMDSLGTAISVALQYGVPVESLVTKFTHQRFEPAGMTHNRDIPFAKSLVDYIFRWLGMEFVPGYRAANAPQRAESKKKSAAATDSMLTKDEHSPARSRAETIARGGVATTNGNGNGNGHSNGNGKSDRALAGTPSGHAPSESRGQSSAEAGGSGANESTLATALKEMQSDAPACDVCGTITVRSGTCYKCMNCGNSMGCS
ncbi:adenosylcobalamin-dependent ribonucleoside-diphosphate reductase [Phycisphaerales bacterium AB-hyl4]|uniref:Vitamin B12-dependent ribonucleotide reductase n=1 Tax=Natronomicrosphaera hydrolytica TaxID=3242702 RepID=A0ABV4U0T5_9BACT